MALGKQIRYYREKLDLTLDQLSTRSGVDTGTISALENRDSSRSKFARAIAKGLGLTTEQLEDETTDWLEKDAGGQQRETPSTPACHNDSVVFSVLDIKASCGSGTVNGDYPEIVRTLTMPPEEAQRLIGSTNRSGTIRIIVASKDSMVPTINPEDLLFVDTSTTDYLGEAVYILLHGGELLCKRLSLVGKTLTVISDNPSYPAWAWEDRPDETRIVGRVLRALPMAFKSFGSLPN